MNLIEFEGNYHAGVVRQGKYRVTLDGHVEVVIETPDFVRSFPSSRDHPDLVTMVNAVKIAVTETGGGQFSINEHRQVIVPAGSPPKYYYAGIYQPDVILKIEDEEFSGRPHDAAGNLLVPGASWVGRPRPGIEYILKAGGADVEYSIALGPQREKKVLLSRIVGPQLARQTARKIAQHKGNSGGRFYVNEYRALFGPKITHDSYEYIFLGVLSDTDPWFPQWVPSGSTGGGPSIAASPAIPSGPSVVKAGGNGAVPHSSPEALPTSSRIEIADGESGHSYDRLFGRHVAGATRVIVEDNFIVRPHQIANLLRFCELCVRTGTVKEIELLTRERTQDSEAMLETIRRSLLQHGVSLVIQFNRVEHDRHIRTDHGWDITLGRGLDIYKRPDDFLAVGASDFNLRPCFATTITYHLREGAPVAPV